MSSNSSTNYSLLAVIKKPYVVKMTHTKIYFTLEFKLLAYKRIQAGHKMRNIVSEIGIDPEILREDRMAGMRSNLLREAASYNGLSDINLTLFQTDSIEKEQIRRFAPFLNDIDQPV